MGQFAVIQKLAFAAGFDVYGEISAPVIVDRSSRRSAISGQALHAADALECAIAIQEAFADYNVRHPEEKLFVRIGLAAGEPIEEKGDLYGAAVNLAARICDAAKAGGVLIAQIVRDEITDQDGRIHFAAIDKLWLKGFDQPVDVYEVVWDQVAPATG